MPVLCVISAGLAVSVILLLVYLKQRKERELELLQMVIGVTEVGDPGLDGHSLNVLYLTMLLYDFLPSEIRTRVNRNGLRYAALLLDLGKLGIPVSVRNKKGKLTDAEWRMVKRHPELGVHFLETVPKMKKTAKWVMYHHERVDGGGYYRLKGEEIPLESRIIAVADTFSAITMVRPYRPSLTYEEAITELKLVAGTQLDAELVRCFCEIPPKRIETCLEDVREKMKKYSYEWITKD